MNWQQWAVGLLIAYSVYRILRAGYSLARRVKENESPCSSCATGCDLKSLKKEYVKECCGDNEQKK